MSNATPGMILVTGGTGKTGRRVVERLHARRLPVRVASRGGQPPFDWNDRRTWAVALRGVEMVYTCFQPDLAVPGATEIIRAFVGAAKAQGVRRLVLLSGRGEEEAQACEAIVQASGLEWTIVRASWFSQNFSESYFRDMIMAGEVALPASEVPEPFVDADDIADVAVAALTTPGHVGQLYEVTGPRMLSMREAIAEIARQSGRDVTFVPITIDQFVAGLRAGQLPDEIVWLLGYLFGTVLDGRNSYLTDGVRQALGRAPKDFSTYVTEAVGAGAWA